VKLDGLVAVPTGVVTETGPVVAPLGTVVEIRVSETTVYTVLTPLNETLDVPLSAEPVIVTTVPTGPELGSIEEIDGGGVTVKLDVLVAVPLSVATEIGPVVAPVGTFVETCVSDRTVNPAVTPLNETADVPERFAPEIVTAVPTGPETGSNEVIDGGAAVTLKSGPIPVPPGVVTETGPVVAPFGTVVVICASESTVNEALAPLKATFVAPASAEPLIVTVVPTGPPSGLIDWIAGLIVTVKSVALVAVPPGVVTETGPVVAPAGTLVVIRVSDSGVKEAITPLNETADAPVRFVPVIVTGVPNGPEVGSNDEIAGAGTGGGDAAVTVKSEKLVAVPPGVVTEMGPVAAPAGTLVVICVSESTVYAALTPPNETSEAPVNAEPVIVTAVPVGPEAGSTPAIDGSDGGGEGS
jgi:hypothetical protein